MSSRNSSRFCGTITAIRVIEDCIRATKKYKEYIGRRYQHPVQGEAFPSETFTKHYEVYPEMEVGLDMSIIDAVFWLGGGTPCIDVMFSYDYRVNRAKVEVKDGEVAVDQLIKAVPHFGDSLATIDSES